MRRTCNFFRTFFASCVAIALAAPLNAQTVILRVDGDNAPTPPGDGLTWPTAFVYLQDALARSEFLLTFGEATLVKIWVAATSPGNPYLPDRNTADQDGSCTPGPCNRDATFELLADVEVYGGFLGGETALSERDPLKNVTVLSGDIDGDGILNNDNSLHVVFADDNAFTSARLDGFTRAVGVRPSLVVS